MADANPDAKVELWAFDEQRVGLKPIIRRVWTRRGHRPIALSKHGYQWLYLYGFVHPNSGKTHFLTMPEVSSEALSLALANFAKTIGVGHKKQVALVLDGAGWHKAKALEVPLGIHFVPLPSYSPELQPAERLWPLTNQAVANRYFGNLKELEQAIGQRCVYLGYQTNQIKALTRFHWWPSLG